MKYSKIIVLKAKLDLKWKNYTEIKKKKGLQLQESIDACFKFFSMKKKNFLGKADSSPN